MNENGILDGSLALRDYVEAEDFRGYDLYDTLNSKFSGLLFGKWLKILATQAQKRNPVNIRKLLLIRKERNPKGIGLFLNAYGYMFQLFPNEEIKKTMVELFNWLIENCSRGYSGYAWGYNFDWADRKRFVKAHTPSSVVTAFVGKGIYSYYSTTKDERAKEILRSSCEFILNDLPRIDNDLGICFSYTPIQKDCVYNVSLLGAELLSLTYSLTKEEHLKQHVKKAVDFAIAHQHSDGHWNYSKDLTTGKEKVQLDFHQGYMLDSIKTCINLTNIADTTYMQALKKGLSFYRQEQFFDDGRSKWRIPKIWPIEIHNQSQGILTFSRSFDIDAQYLDFAITIAEWTIANMQSTQGYFYNRKYNYYSNKIPYMRWGQAWMLLALSQLLLTKKTKQ